MAHFKLCFTLAIIVGLFSFAHPQTPGDFQTFCRKTSFADFCIATINAFGTARLKVDVKGWLQILNFKSISASILTITKIGQALRANPNADLQNRLNICNDDFNQTEGILDAVAWPDLTHDNYVDYNTQVGRALIIVEDCIGVFNRAPAIQSPVAALTKTTEDDIKLVLEGLNINQCDKRTACT